jgi:hypothetical protein
LKYFKLSETDGGSCAVAAASIEQQTESTAKATFADAASAQRAPKPGLLLQKKRPTIDDCAKIKQTDNRKACYN